MYNLEKKAFKKQINKTGLMLLCYDAAMLIGPFIYMIALMLMYTIYYMSANLEEIIYNSDADSIAGVLSSFVINRIDLATIFGSLAGLIIIIVFRQRRFISNDLKPKNKTMKPGIIMIAFVGFMALQFCNTVITNLLEMFFNLFGFSVVKAFEEVSINNTLPMILYTGFIAPIVEEFIFRGTLLRSLEKHGRVFAIVFSAILFGFMHGNITQGIFAALTGLILGYIALEYSMKWAVLLHIMNNLLLGVLLGTWLEHTPNLPGETIVMIIWFICLLISLVLLIMKRRSIRDYLRLNHSPKGTYRYAFSSWTTIVFILINLGMCLMMITKL